MPSTQPFSPLFLFGTRYFNPWLNNQPITLLPSPTFALSDWLTKSTSATLPTKADLFNAALHKYNGFTCDRGGGREARYIKFSLCQRFIDPGMEVGLGFIHFSLEGVWLLITGFL